MKPFIKRDERTDGRTHARTDIGHFIISRPGPIGRREIKIYSNGYIFNIPVFQNWKLLISDRN